MKIILIQIFQKIKIEEDGILKGMYKIKDYSNYKKIKFNCWDQELYLER